MRTAAAFAAIVLAASLAACGSAPASHRGAATAAAQPATPPSDASVAATAECARFTTISGTITAGTADDSTVGELVSTLSVSGLAWQNALSAASDPADGMAAGTGRAYALWVDIKHAAIAFGVLNLDADEGKIGMVNRAWGSAKDAMTKAANACAS